MAPSPVFSRSCFIYSSFSFSFGVRVLDIGGVGVVIGVVGVGRGVVGVVVLGAVVVGEEEEEASVVVSSSRPPKYLTACIHRPEGV